MENLYRWPDIDCGEWVVFARNVVAIEGYGQFTKIRLRGRSNWAEIIVDAPPNEIKMLTEEVKARV